MDKDRFDDLDIALFKSVSDNSARWGKKHFMDVMMPYSDLGQNSFPDLMKAVEDATSPSESCIAISNLDAAITRVVQGMSKMVPKYADERKKRIVAYRNVLLSRNVDRELYEIKRRVTSSLERFKDYVVGVLRVILHDVFGDKISAEEIEAAVKPAKRSRITTATVGIDNKNQQETQQARARTPRRPPPAAARRPSPTQKKSPAAADNKTKALRAQQAQQAQEAAREELETLVKARSSSSSSNNNSSGQPQATADGLQHARLQSGNKSFSVRGHRENLTA